MATTDIVGEPITSATESEFETFVESTETILSEYSTTQPDYYTDIDEANDTLGNDLESTHAYTVFQVFAYLDIALPCIEIVLISAAAILIPRWRRNYRNHLLMQLSIARIIKRIIFIIKFIATVREVNHELFGLQIYVDFVICIIVVFLIKHMYDSFIIVIVKISEYSLWKEIICGWLVPVPVTAAWMALLVLDVVGQKRAYLLICCVCRWPLMLIGTLVYITILYNVLTDKILRFARSISILTFLLCFIINLYLLLRDVVYLWCVNSYSTILLTYLFGFVMNCLILSLYITLITFTFRGNNKRVRESAANYSLTMPTNNPLE